MAKIIFEHHYQDQAPECPAMCFPAVRSSGLRDSHPLSSHQSQWDIVPSSFIWLCSLLVSPQLLRAFGLAGWLWLLDRVWREREMSLYDKQCSFTLRSASCPLACSGCLPSAGNSALLSFQNSMALTCYLCCAFSPYCCLA